VIAHFLTHLSKNFFRSSSVGKGIAIQIILGFIALAIVTNLLAVGWVLEGLIVERLKQSNSIVFLNGLLIYYFIGEFVIRYFMQSLPSWDVPAYLHLPISRSKIVNFLLGRSMLHIINIFVLLLYTPFALSAIANVYGVPQAWIWLLSLWLISLVNHFIVVLLKKNPAYEIGGIFVFIVLCAGLAGSDYFGLLKLSIVSEKLFGSLSQGYTGLCILFLLLILLYVSAYRLFINRLYPEELSVQQNQTFRSAEWTFFQNFGLRGSWIKTEFKLIFRNKRSREIFLLNIAVYFQTLILYHITHPCAYGSLLFFGIIGSGFFAIMYGQFLFSWQGQHFDFTYPTHLYSPICGIQVFVFNIHYRVMVFV
jgi:hypothetical protein